MWTPFKDLLTSMGVSTLGFLSSFGVFFGVSMRLLTHNHRQLSSKLLKVTNKCIFECKNFGQDWICPVHKRLPKSQMCFTLNNKFITTLDMLFSATYYLELHNTIIGSLYIFFFFYRQWSNSSFGHYRTLSS